MKSIHFFFLILTQQSNITPIYNNILIMTTQIPTMLVSFDFINKVVDLDIQILSSLQKGGVKNFEDLADFEKKDKSNNVTPNIH